MNNSVFIQKPHKFLTQFFRFVKSSRFSKMTALLLLKLFLPTRFWQRHCQHELPCNSWTGSSQLNPKNSISLWITPKKAWNLMKLEMLQHLPIIQNSQGENLRAFRTSSSQIHNAFHYGRFRNNFRILAHPFKNKENALYKIIFYKVKFFNC